MSKAELESKHLSELHALAAEAGVSGYRMLPRAELIEKLADGGASGGGGGGGSSQRSREPRERKERQPRSGGGRERKPRGGGRDRQRSGGGGDRQPRRPEAEKREQPKPEAPGPAAARPQAREDEPTGKPRRRRRRRFRRKGSKTVQAHEMLVPSVPGRQALVYAESRAACTSLLRELAAELSSGKGPDPVALLVDPSPEELADWKREAPKAEIVSAGQERHAEDALAQAARRADEGEAVILLIDSLSRLAESFGGSNTAKDLFDAGASAGTAGGGSLTVVAAVERSG